MGDGVGAGETAPSVPSATIVCARIAAKGASCVVLRLMTPARIPVAVLFSLTVKRSSKPLSALVVEEKSSVLNG